MVLVLILSIHLGLKGGNVSEVLLAFNEVVWVIANILICYISVAILLFVIGYYAFFDPKATTAGKFIFRFMLSLVGIVTLIYVGTFIDPPNNADWIELPKHVEFWQPLARLAVYSYVAFTITSLAIVLGYRKWKPEKLLTAPDVDIPVKLRKNDKDYRY